MPIWQWLIENTFGVNPIESIIAVFGIVLLIGWWSVYGDQRR